MIALYIVPPIIIYVWLLLVLGLLCLTGALILTAYDVLRWVWSKVF